METGKPAALSASEKPQASRSPADRSCPGVQHTVAEQDRRRSFGPSPNSRKNRSRIAAGTSSHLQDRDNTILDSNVATPAWVGVDIAKDKFDVHVRPLARRFTCANDAEGFAQLIDELRLLPALQMVVVEASGGYERSLVSHIIDSGLPVSVVNPRQVRDFAKCMGLRARQTPLMRRSWLISLNSSKLASLRKHLKTSKSCSIWSPAAGSSSNSAPWSKIANPWRMAGSLVRPSSRRSSSSTSNLPKSNWRSPNSSPQTTIGKPSPTSSAACLASERRPPSSSSLKCPNLATPTALRPRPWPGSPHTTMTAENSKDAAASPVDGSTYVPRCTWLLSLHGDVIQCSSPSRRASRQPVNRTWLFRSPACASFWSSSTPYSKPAKHGIQASLNKTPE